MSAEAARRRIHPAGDDVSDRACHRHTINLYRDRHRVGRDAVDEIHRPVDGVQHPRDRAAGCGPQICGIGRPAALFAENRVTRLKGFLFAFMMARGIKKLEGEKSDIGIQRNSSASLVIDDPLQIAERLFERNVRFNKTELQEIVYQLTEGEVRRRLELALNDGWEVNGEAIRAALVNQEAIAGARLVTGSHVRVR